MSSDVADTGHGCPVDGCTRNVPYQRLMCPADWRLVPKPLQSAVYAAWANGRGAGTPAHQAAMDAAIAAANAARAETTTAPPGRRPDGAVKCPTCEAAGTEAWIIFVPVANNAGRKLRQMPLNAEPDPGGNVIVTRIGTGALRARVATKGEKAVPPEVTYCPHFATCKDSAAHRRRQRGNWTSAVNARNADQRRGRTRAAPPDIGPGMTRLYPGDRQ